MLWFKQRTHQYGSESGVDLKAMEMRLPEFIQLNVEPILVEWEAFARIIWPENCLADPVELRDSAAQILCAVVEDMATSQTSRQQSQKSQGRRPAGTESDHLDDASEVHGTARAGSGLSLAALMAEYRALRATVLRLWRESLPKADLADINDITRFNESIDQSLARAVTSSNKRLDASRNMFLAILGHDVRNPLAAITLSAKVAQAEKSISPDLTELLSRIVSSAGTISELVSDLIDFTSSAMGVRLPISVGPLDLYALCTNVIKESRAASHGRAIRCTTQGDLAGQWDSHRLRQVFANLVGNALQHGSPSDPITLTLDGSAENTVTISVHNTGVPIPPHILPTIFDPLVRGRTAVHKRHTPGSIGLGLYIAKEIVVAHGGTILLNSSIAEGTTAIVRLPRRPCAVTTL